MKFLVVAWLILRGADALWAQAPLSKLPRFEFYGHSYVRLQDWAEANSFKVAWPRKESVLATNRWARLKFDINTRKAEIDGVTIYLSVPIAARNGSAYVSPQDLQTAIQPVLFPVKNVPGQEVRTICLDPGHGGPDPGNHVGSQLEKKYTLFLAQELKTLLTDAGLKVVLTRSTDTFVALPDRPDFARRRGADLFVSLHFNAFAGGAKDAKGVEVYCLTPAGASSTNARGEGTENESSPGNRNNSRNLLLAYQLQKQLERSVGLEDRGVRRARFAVLRTATMPAVLIEGGYMSHPDELRRIADPAHLKQMARAIVDGVLAYKRLVER